MKKILATSILLTVFVTALTGCGSCGKKAETAPQATAAATEKATDAHCANGCEHKDKAHCASGCAHDAKKDSKEVACADCKDQKEEAAKAPVKKTTKKK